MITLSTSSLRLPRCDQFVRQPSASDLSVRIEKANGESLDLPLPIFWFDPPWHHVPVERCRDISRAVAGTGIIVSALHRELSQQDDCDVSEFFPRLAPHRCDRAGWIHRDVENAVIIDLRLTPSRDEHGRFAYNSAQLTRWENVDAQPTDNAESTIDAMLFPPEWRTLEDMATKVLQLRELSSAAVFASFDASNMSTAIAPAIRAKVDGIIIRTSSDPLACIHEARQQMNQIETTGKTETTGRTARPALWLATDQELSPQDCVKCFAMGADAISADAICNRFLREVDAGQGSSAARAAFGLGFRASGEREQRLREAVDQMIRPWIESIRGLVHSCGVESHRQLSHEHLVTPFPIGPSLGT